MTATGDAASSTGRSAWLRLAALAFASIAVATLWLSEGAGITPARRTDGPAVPDGKVVTESFVWSGPAPSLSINPRTIVAIGSGFAAAGATPASSPGAWWSDDGVDWTEAPLDAMPTGVARVGDGFVAFRGNEGTRFQRRGSGFEMAGIVDMPAFVRIGYESSRPALTATTRGVAVQSVYGELYFGSFEQGFQLAVTRGEWGLAIDDPWLAATAPRLQLPCSPRRLASNDYAPILEADGRLIAFVSGAPDAPHGLFPACSPRPWSSTSGFSWSPLSPEPVFPEAAYVFDIAHRDGLFVAVGGIEDDPAIWTSADAVQWDRVPWLQADGRRPIAVASGGAGWVVLAMGSDGPPGWVSTDGRCWSPLPADVEAMHAAVGDDVILLGGAAADPRLWVGNATHREACHD